MENAVARLPQLTGTKTRTAPRLRAARRRQGRGEAARADGPQRRGWRLNCARLPARYSRPRAARPAVSIFNRPVRRTPKPNIHRATCPGDPGAQRRAKRQNHSGGRRTSRWPFDGNFGQDACLEEPGRLVRSGPCQPATEECTRCPARRSALSPPSATSCGPADQECRTRCASNIKRRRGEVSRFPVSSVTVVRPNNGGHRYKRREPPVVAPNSRGTTSRRWFKDSGE